MSNTKPYHGMQVTLRHRFFCVGHYEPIMGSTANSILWMVSYLCPCHLGRH